MTLPPHIKNETWVSRKKDETVKIMIKTKNLSWKRIEDNGTLKVRVRLKFCLFYSELAPTDLWCNMLRDFNWTENIWGGNVRWAPSQLPTTFHFNMKTVIVFKHQQNQIYSKILTNHCLIAQKTDNYPCDSRQRFKRAILFEV